MYSIADIINGCFEGFAGSFVCINCFRVYKDKKVRGASKIAVAFFTAWGFWNLYYYPSLEQWWSFVGGLGIVVANAVWLALMWKYRKA